MIFVAIHVDLPVPGYRRRLLLHDGRYLITFRSSHPPLLPHGDTTRSDRHVVRAANIDRPKHFLDRCLLSSGKLACLRMFYL